ncbi:MAG: LysM peptidoglycan-binding domain-containing protein [Candidatus Latescibacterota bacterium]|jgi:LysM repeat protein
MLYLYILAIICLSVAPCAPAEGKATVHVVHSGDTLSAIAQRYGVAPAQIAQWNSLKDDRIQVGQKLKLWIAGDWYQVHSGDTLSGIAQRFSVSLAQLRQFNKLNNDHIKIGQKLRLKPKNPTRTEAIATHNGIYQVRLGDNLSRIAQAHHVRVNDLKQWNNLSRDAIRPGQKLRIKAPAPSPTEEDLQPYTVQRGDTLSEIAQRFDIALDLLRRINSLANDAIKPGQKLRLRPSALDEAVHVVQSGETLSAIGQRYRIDLDTLRQLNEISGDRILVGQKLRLRQASSAIHMVERGDAIWEIARAYGMSVAQLKELNELNGSRIYPGQELKLSASSAPRYAIYTVRAGDYLGEIARLHQMSVSELRQLNELKGSIIHPGDPLKVRPFRWLEISDIDWDSLQLDQAGKYAIDNGPYYGTRPKASRQKSTKYYENHPHSPLKTYRTAEKLWRQFENKVNRMGRLSNALDGWHIVLDPGHGGLDPGAVVETVDGNGEKLYVAEDEYVFDIALRVYVLLSLHGAQATMTLLSPNHLIRHNNPPAATFVNEKNEVYNSLAHNRSNTVRDWPRGGNLSARVKIARQAFAKAPRGRRIFLSFHADIDQKAPEAPLVLYYESRSGHRRDNISRQFAQSLLNSLGAGARARGQGLGVLRDNPADVKALIEMRNMAYRDHVWALRFEQLRHRDAEKVVRGLLDYARGRTRSARR